MALSVTHSVFHFTSTACLVYASMYISMDCWLLAFAFMYVAMDFLVFIVFHFMNTLVLIVICRDFLCYLVYRPQCCNKL